LAGVWEELAEDALQPIVGILEVARSRGQLLADAVLLALEEIER